MSIVQFGPTYLRVMHTRRGSSHLRQVFQRLEIPHAKSTSMTPCFTQPISYTSTSLVRLCSVISIFMHESSPSFLKAMPAEPPLSSLMQVRWKLKVTLLHRTGIVSEAPYGILSDLWPGITGAAKKPNLLLRFNPLAGAYNVATGYAMRPPFYVLHLQN